MTGASGFLGRRLCQRLQAEGERVVALGRSPREGPWDEYRSGDLSAETALADKLEGISVVYHLASRAHALSETPADAEAYRPVIVGGTRRLLEASRQAGVRRFVYISSVKAMGEGNPPGYASAPVTEEWPHTPQSPYGLCKAEAEALVRESGLPHRVILRPVMIYGPGEKGNLPRMVEAVRRGRFPPLPEAGNKRSMIHVDDVVEYCLRAATFPIASGKTYILSPEEALSTRELYDLIREALALPRQRWAVPSALLTGAAGLGTFLGYVLKRRLPLDLEVLRKLTGSAWYSGEKGRKELAYTCQITLKEWLNAN